MTESLECRTCGGDLTTAYAIAALCDPCFEDASGVSLEVLPDAVLDRLASYDPLDVDVEILSALVEMEVRAVPGATIPAPRTPLTTPASRATAPAPAKPFNPLAELSPSPKTETALNLVSGWEKARTPAPRVAAPCPLPVLPAGTLTELVLVTAGNTLANVSAALESWADLIGDEMPAETTALLSRAADPALEKAARGSEVKEAFVDALRRRVERCISSLNSYGELEVVTSFERPDTRTTISKGRYYGYHYGGGHTSSAAETHLVSLALLLSSPRARQAAGLLEVSATVEPPPTVLGRITRRRR